MHQLWQHPNGIWYILYGPRLKRRISARTKDRGEAEVYLSQFIAGSQEPSLDAPTIGGILDGYEAERTGNVRSPNALKFGVRPLKHLLGNLRPEQITPTVIGRYAAERGAGAGTVLREVGILRAALAWAKGHNLIEAFPQIPNPVKAPPPRERWLTKDEARKLLECCTEFHVKLFITLGLATAARSGAILDAKWPQVDFKHDRIDFGPGHGNKRRTVVPLNTDAMSALQAAKRLACSPYVIEFRGKRVTTIKTGFAAACRRAGLKGVTPHILRHTAATWATIENTPLQEVAKLLGDSLATVERVYAKWSPDYLKGAVTALQIGPIKPQPKKKRGKLEP